MAVRYVYMAALANPHTCTVKVLPAGVVRLSFPKRKGFDYDPGQYVFVMIPSVNVFEWHPFSISSSPHTDTVSCAHMRG